MKRFAFRLQRLEKLRQGERRQARSALAAALASADNARRRREALALALRDAEAYRLSGKSATDPRALRELANWREALRSALVKAGEDEIAAVEEVRAAERRYTEASRAHRVLEKMHKRKRTRWYEAFTREEQKFLDEIHLLRLAREHVGEEASR
jgi:flagellar export protein FliJ